jgi:programmed cell death protein 5
LSYEQKDNQPNKASEEEAQRKSMRENIIRMALTSEARQRLTNVRMVKPEIARTIEEYVIQLASSGRLKSVIDDEQLKTLLGSMAERQRKEFKIRRI